MIKQDIKYELALNNINDTAMQIIDFDHNCKIFMLEGQMGSGKTTLIKSLCRSLGSNDGLGSPTFSIVNEYSYSGGKIFHFDLYRLKKIEELLDIGFEDYIYSGNYCFIEWPELAERFLRKDFLKININVNKNIHYLRLSKF
jgi:tRNA threonylcarbamoyladenosine biosynthesis protein TsaE